VRWWVCAVLFAAAVVDAAPAPKLIATAQITSELRASLTAEYTIDVSVMPHDGDAWTRLAKRVTGDAANWRAIAALNSDKLTTDVAVRIPFALLRAELQRQIITTLFPKDSLTPAGWKHVATGPAGVESESLWSIAEWFTGRGENYTAIRSANPSQTLWTHPGDVVLIPKQLLSAAFGGEGEELNASSKTAEVRKSEDDHRVSRAAGRGTPSPYHAVSDDSRQQRAPSRVPWTADDRGRNQLVWHRRRR